MIGKILDFVAVVAMIFFVVPIAFNYEVTLLQALAIALLAFMAKDLLLVEPEIYIVNGNQNEGDAE